MKNPHKKPYNDTLLILLQLSSTMAWEDQICRETGEHKDLMGI